MSDKTKDLNSPSPWNVRIWDEAKHQWLCDSEDDGLPYYGFDIRGGEVTAMQGMDWVYRQFEHGRKLIWERSTGLADKNGKEIYEGDIIKDHSQDTYPVGRVMYSAEWCVYEIVSYDPEDCRVYNLESFSPTVNGYLEVIGNVHENKELLGDEEWKK